MLACDEIAMRRGTWKLFCEAVFSWLGPWRTQEQRHIDDLRRRDNSGKVAPDAVADVATNGSDILLSRRDENKGADCGINQGGRVETSSLPLSQVRFTGTELSSGAGALSQEAPAALMQIKERKAASTDRRTRGPYGRPDTCLCSKNTAYKSLVDLPLTLPSVVSGCPALPRCEFVRLHGMRGVPKQNSRAAVLQKRVRRADQQSDGALTNVIRGFAEEFRQEARRTQRASAHPPLGVAE